MGKPFFLIVKWLLIAVAITGSVVLIRHLDDNLHKAPPAPAPTMPITPR